MTVNDYIQQKFQTFGIQLSKAELYEICRPAHIVLDIENMDDLDDADYNRLMVNITQFIPSLLLRATSIGESGFSMSWNIEGIKDYYSFLCKKYGLKDELNTNKPKCTFL